MTDATVSEARGLHIKCFIAGGQTQGSKPIKKVGSRDRLDSNLDLPLGSCATWASLLALSGPQSPPH